MAFYKIYPPEPELGKLIREIQLYHIKWDEEEENIPPYITCLANTEQNLYLFPRDPMRIVPAVNVEIPAAPAIVTGPKNRPVGLIFGKDHLMIKIAFYPTGTYRLCGTNMKATVNAGIDAFEIWHEDINDVLAKLRQLVSYDEMIVTISDFLLRKFDAKCRPHEPIDDVAVAMLDPLAQLNIVEWASKSCLSLRQFERNFMVRVGISPKLFLRIVRFEHAMHVKNTTQASWSEIAMINGYTDSSHLLKEFKKFAHFPPSQFYLKPTSGHSTLPSG
tara:strand:- start:2449 stop:3273 length:825 start_codon:yes stop_codon:yes gene_type:complete